MVETKGKITNLLWTGGWDSTFRLLQLVLQEKVQVQPFYLIDADRQSTGIEIKTMRNIKNCLLREYPLIRNLLFPTKFFEVADIKADTEISKAFQIILVKKYLGEQYDWLARFCEQKHINKIELCVHQDDKAHNIIAPYIKGQSILKVNGPEHTLFKYYVFPIFNLSKIEMAKISETNNWNRYMNMTWFCHKPRNGKPCGRCNPCLYTIREGMAYRVPLSNRISGFAIRKFLALHRKCRQSLYFGV
jgi:hypothetical protein